MGYICDGLSAWLDPVPDGLSFLSRQKLLAWPGLSCPRSQSSTHDARERVSTIAETSPTFLTGPTAGKLPGRVERAVKGGRCCVVEVCSQATSTEASRQRVVDDRHVGHPWFEFANEGRVRRMRQVGIAVGHALSPHVSDRTCEISTPDRRRPLPARHAGRAWPRFSRTT